MCIYGNWEPGLQSHVTDVTGGRRVTDERGQYCGSAHKYVRCGTVHI